MSFGGGKTQTVENKIPAYIESNHEFNIGLANDISDNPYTKYEGPQIAGLSPEQAAALYNLKQNQGSWRDGMSAAADTAKNALSFKSDNVHAQNIDPNTMDAALIYPGAVGDVGAHAVNRADISNVGAHAINRSDVRNVAAGALTDMDLRGYMNPYMGAVADATRADIERTGALSDQALRARYAAAGAFGGTRQAVAQAEGARNTAEVVAKTLGDLRSSGYAQAVGSATADLNRRFAADQSNQQVDFSVAGANQTAAQKADLANQQADITISQGNQTAAQNADTANQRMAYQIQSGNAGMLNSARQFNAATENEMKNANANRGMQAEQLNQQAGMSAAALRLDAGKILAGLTQQTTQAAEKDAQTLWNVGAQDQATRQQDMDLQAAEWADRQKYPIDMLGLRQSVLTGAPYSTSTTQPVYKNAGAGALAGAISGGKLASQLGFTGNDALWGAGLGGLLSLFA